jgi:hypothetical protein
MLVILPIFLGMTCLIGFSRYTAEIHEIRWGLREEIASYATAIAAFLTPTDATRNAEMQTDRIPRQHALQTILDRIDVTARQRLRYVILYDAAGQRPLATWGNTPEGRVPTVPSAMLALLQEQDLVLGAVPPVGATQQLMTVYAPLKVPRLSATPAALLQGTGATALLGIVLVAMEARDEQVQAQQIFRQLSRQSVLILLLGLVLSLIISAMLSRPINALTQFVARASGTDGGYEPSGVISIQEFNDLGNTFDTMRNVLEEAETRLNRLLIQGTQFRSRIDLARVYVEDFWPPLQGRYGNVEVVGGLLGEKFTGSFFGVVEGRDGFYALVGRVQGHGDLDPVVMASGVWSFIKEDLRHLEPQEAFERVADILVFEAFVCLQWTEAHPLCKVWTMEPFEPAAQHSTRPFQPPDLLRIVHQYCALAQCRQPFCPDDPVAIHTFSGDTAEKIAIYLRRFPQLSAKDLLQELAIFLGPECDGAVLLLQHTGMAPASVRSFTS